MNHYFLRFKDEQARAAFVKYSAGNTLVSKLFVGDSFVVGSINPSGHVYALDLQGNGLTKSTRELKIPYDYVLTRDEVSGFFEKIPAAYSYIASALDFAKGCNILNAVRLYEDNLVIVAKRNKIEALAQKAEKLRSELASLVEQMGKLKQEIRE